MKSKKKRVVEIVVEESEKTRKTRQKLFHRIQALEEKVTQTALQEKTEEISSWIARNASERVVVQKDVSLFDQNQNPAKPSKGIAKIQEELSQEELTKEHS